MNKDINNEAATKTPALWPTAQTSSEPDYGAITFPERGPSLSEGGLAERLLLTGSVATKAQ